MLLKGCEALEWELFRLTEVNGTNETNESPSCPSIPWNGGTALTAIAMGVTLPPLQGPGQFL
jgi:hypothetical protein